ncbi:MAG: transketolase [Alphaproteobacteria bacterium]
MRKVCLDMVHALAREDQRIVFIGSDLGDGTLKAMKKEFPDRFFMEGISEQNIVGMAAGMAMDGFIPYVNTISTFLTRRALEQVAVDLCLHRLPVRLIGNGGGMVYAPLGPTHLATEDMALLRALPNMAVLAPVDAEQMRRLMPKTVDWPGPLYIRLAKGGDPIVSRPTDPVDIGRAILMREPGRAAIIATGPMVGRALAAADQLGEPCGVLDCFSVKPLDEAAVLDLGRRVTVLVTVEEHTRIGGLGSAVLETLSDHLDGPMPRVIRLGLPDAFPDDYGSQDEHLAKHGMDVEGIVAAVRRGLGSK